VKEIKLELEKDKSDVKTKDAVYKPVFGKKKNKF